ncbi:MAG: hypothetical protein RLZZ127_2232, partial [Planctomycetota bacterium]
SLADARLASGIAASKDDGAGSRPPGVPTPAAERNMDGRAPVASTGDATAGGRQLTGAAPGRRRGADAASAAAAGSGSVRQDRSGGRDRVVPAPAAEASRHPDQGRGTLPGTGIGSGPQFLPVIPSLLR